MVGSREQERVSRTINYEPALEIVQRDELVARDVVIVAVVVRCEEIYTYFEEEEDLDDYVCNH